MSERTTAEMVADQHADANWIVLPYPKEAKRIHEAADRLAELEAENQDVQAEWAKMRSALAAIHDQLPPCSTCGGTRNVWKNPSNRASTTVVGCPDCPEHPGKVSIEQLVATWKVLWGPGIDAHAGDETVDRVWRAAYNSLRSVKP